MKKKFLRVAILFTIMVTRQSRADIYVIVNASNNVASLNRTEITDIFLGRKKTFSDEHSALPIDQKGLRSEFYQKLTERSIEQINAYWAQLLFSGQISPPMIASTNEEVIKTVSENTGAIGYINENKNKDKYRVLLTIK